MRKPLAIVPAFALAMMTAGHTPTPAHAHAQQEPPVKMSKSGICHPKGGTYYSRTKNFRPFQSMKDCLEAGGRRPRS